MYKCSKLAKSVRLAMVFGAGLGLSVNALAAEDDAKKAEATKTAEKEVEKITVTGSRIRRDEIEQSRPVFTFDASNIATGGFTNAADLLNQSPLFGGSQSPAGAQDPDNAGQNQVNLFDLGTQRTLTLVNGRRLVSSQSAGIGGSQVDINAIPAALIDRIETVPLTGAATYGADAIAGTVNVILKDDYEGFEFNAQYGNNEDGNARTFQISTLAGGNLADGRGNITFGLEYTKEDGQLECDQSYLCDNNWDFDSTQKELLDLNGDGLPDDVNGDGKIDKDDEQSIRLGYQEIRLALFSPYGSVTKTGGSLPQRGIGALGDGNFYQFTQGGDLETCQPGPTQSSGIRTRGSDNCGTDFFDSVAQIRSPTTRLNAYASLNYELTEDLVFKQDFIFANTKGSELVNQGGFQTGFFGGTSAAIQMDINNPFLSDQARKTLVDGGITDSFNVHRFNNDIVGLGANSNETQLWRVSNILEGEFTLAERDFYWDVSVVHGRSDVTIARAGIVDGRFLNAVDARRIDADLLEKIRLQDPDNLTDDLVDNAAALTALQKSNKGFTANFKEGDIICGAYADLAAGTLTGFNSRASGSGLTDEDIPFLDGCQPLNIFGEAGNEEALEFVTGGPQIATANNLQTVFTANLGGTVLDLPAGPLDFVIGTERRIEKGNYSPSLGLRVPVTRSSVDKPVKGGFETEEYYVELVAPVIDESMDIPLVRSFEVSAAYRYQEFETNAPKGFEDRTTDASVSQLSFKWQIIDDLAFRGTKASAFRNPSIQELFQPASQSFISGADPCDRRSVTLGPNPSARRANCESIGIDTDNFESKIQNGTIPGGIVSGNSELTPETNESYSLGFIYTPEFIEGLQIAVDYYNLEIEDYIDDVTFATQAATCFDSNAFDLQSTACRSFVRDGSNQVVSATQGPANVALSTFESVTLRAFYEFDIADMGSISIDAFTQNNITNEFRATDDAELTEDVGDYADPDWLGTVDTSWKYDDILVNWRMRWQKSVKLDAMDQRLYASRFEQLDNGAYTGNFTNRAGSRFINDLSARYNITESSSIQLNILNLLDRKPDANGPLAAAGGHFGLDERLGRRFSVRYNASF